MSLCPEIDDLIDAQGWDADGYLALLEDFIDEEGLVDNLCAYLQRWAGEENEDGHPD